MLLISLRIGATDLESFWGEKKERSGKSIARKWFAKGGKGATRESLRISPDVWKELRRLYQKGGPLQQNKKWFVHTCGRGRLTEGFGHGANQPEIGL